MFLLAAHRALATRPLGQSAESFGSRHPSSDPDESPMEVSGPPLSNAVVWADAGPVEVSDGEDEVDWEDEVKSSVAWLAVDAAVHAFDLLGTAAAEAEEVLAAAEAEEVLADAGPLKKSKRKRKRTKKVHTSYRKVRIDGRTGRKKSQKRGKGDQRQGRPSMRRHYKDAAQEKAYRKAEEQRLDRKDKEQRLRPAKQPSEEDSQLSFAEQISQVGLATGVWKKGHMRANRGRPKEGGSVFLGRKEGSRDLTKEQRKNIDMLIKKVFPPNHRRAGKRMYSLVEIATDVGASRNTVWRYATGQTHKASSGRGRPRIPEVAKKALQEDYLHQRHKAGTNKKRRRLVPISVPMRRTGWSLQWGKSSARNALREIGLKCRRSRVKPFQTNEDRAKRLAWGKEYAKFSREHWQKNVVFVDCKCFAVKTTALKKLVTDAREIEWTYRLRSEGLLQECVRPSKFATKSGGRGGVNIYAAVADGKMVMFSEYRKWNGQRAACKTAELRKRCKELWPEKDVIVLCHDNDKSFNSNVNSAAEIKHKFDFMRIPARSPEFMPLDYSIWVWILNKMREWEEDHYSKSGALETGRQYKQRLGDTAFSIPADVVDRALGCMVDHIQQVIHHDGGHWEDGKQATNRWRQRRIEEMESDRRKKALFGKLLANRKGLRKKHEKMQEEMHEGSGTCDPFSDIYESLFDGDEDPLADLVLNEAPCADGADGGGGGEGPRDDGKGGEEALVGAALAAAALLSKPDEKKRKRAPKEKHGSKEAEEAEREQNRKRKRTSAEKPGSKGGTGSKQRPPPPPGIQPGSTWRDLGDDRTEETVCVEVDWRLTRPSAGFPVGAWERFGGAFAYDESGVLDESPYPGDWPMPQSRLFRTSRRVWLDRAFTKMGMPGDGSCCFHSLSTIQNAAGMSTADEVRKWCAEQVLDTPVGTVLESEEGGGETLGFRLRYKLRQADCEAGEVARRKLRGGAELREVYHELLLSRRKDGRYATWGTDLEIALFAHHFCKVIYVYHPQDGGRHEAQHAFKGTQETGSVAHILSTDTTHFDVLRPVARST